MNVDDQGRPLKIIPLINNSELIKKSPLFSGQTSTFKRIGNINKGFSFVGKVDPNKPLSFDEEAMELKFWLLNWGVNDEKQQEQLPETDKLYNREEYRPLFLF